jgi:predicted kinase
MPIEFFILAGPQAAGKSTFAKSICANEPRVVSLEESRQIIVHNYQRKGAIFMTELDEIEVIHHDMTRMFTILGQNRRQHLYLDETNVFTLAHARAHGIDLLEGYFRQYCDLLTRLNTGVVFIDVPPEISWERRRHRYAQRLWELQDEERHEIMMKYKQYLNRLHPELVVMYDRLELPKEKIDGAAGVADTSLAVVEAFRRLRGRL